MKCKQVNIVSKFQLKCFEEMWKSRYCKQIWADITHLWGWIFHSMHLPCPPPGGRGVATKLGRNVQTFIFIQKLPLKCWRPELGQILHNCCSEARLVTKYCKFNRQLFEARNMTDLLTVSGNNHLLLQMVFAQVLFKIKVWPSQTCMDCASGEKNLLY